MGSCRYRGRKIKVQLACGSLHNREFCIRPRNLQNTDLTIFCGLVRDWNYFYTQSDNPCAKPPTSYYVILSPIAIQHMLIAALLISRSRITASRTKSVNHGMGRSGYIRLSSSSLSVNVYKLKVRRERLNISTNYPSYILLKVNSGLKSVGIYYNMSPVPTLKFSSTCLGQQLHRNLQSLLH